MLDSQPDNRPYTTQSDERIPEQQPQSAQPVPPGQPLQSAPPPNGYYPYWQQYYAPEQANSLPYSPYWQPTEPMQPMQQPAQTAQVESPVQPIQPAPSALPQQGMAPTTNPMPSIPSGGRPVTNRPPRGLRTGAIFLLALVLAVVFGTGLFAGWEYGRGGTATAPSKSNGLQSGSGSQTPVPVLTTNNVDAVREAVVKKVSPSVVQINVNTSQGAALGSGVIIDQRGYIITNDHVVSGASSIQVVLYDGTRETATLTGTDAADDLAVIKITPPSHMIVASLGDSSQLKVGQSVMAIGNPLGITQTVTNNTRCHSDRCANQSWE